MFLASLLSNAGYADIRVKSTAEVVLGDGPKITSIFLTCDAEVPGCEAAEFSALAETAKAACPVSKALSGVDTITVDATLTA